MAFHDDESTDDDNVLFEQELAQIETPFFMRDNTWCLNKVTSVLSNIIKSVNLKIPVYHQNFQIFGHGVVLTINKTELFLHSDLINNLSAHNQVNKQFMDVVNMVYKKILGSV